ncbi:amidohydrolase family protein [Amycolatopsis jiangsuensis]|uniref:Putative TIM-barrel fold metal-dependent hydrolase n=1 Tax=Amycolatopsis jiangsuensis TaxID=1181879 RepID=A0A840J5G1_9PSEU|nr:amidohydrolase family protein [Amycolatopsis jiangsuensis]MBB4689270.1 putative TIM-barrel fold metal-dependent hydrolase [Amycolatopsis jiangsuensis]
MPLPRRQLDPAALRALVDTLGVSQVMVGSDYPYPLGERPAGDVVRRARYLEEAEIAAITHGNAHRFLGPADG